VRLPLPGSMRLAPGVRLDAYELVCPLGQGGMANVWIARQTEGAEGLVAIKTILPKFASDTRFQRMLVDEARIALRIHHVNVARILRLVRRGDVSYLVMEYVDGDSLSTIQRALQERGIGFPPGVLLRIMADVCDGLHAAHELRDVDGRFLCVVHRDVSPPNVLVDRCGMARLIDFGVAKAHNRVADETTTGNIKGKVPYMAPEQVDGHPLDRRVDIWGVGATMYRCLAGRPPFEAETDAMTLLAIGRRAPLAPLPRNVPGEIAAIVTRALQFSPSDRFVTAAWMKVAIEDAMVRAKLVTTSAMVAGFLQSHIGHLGRKRSEQIALGLMAARGQLNPDLLKAWEPPPASPSLSSVPSTVVEPLLRRQSWRAWRRALVLVGAVAGVALWAGWRTIPMAREGRRRNPAPARPPESIAADASVSYDSGEIPVTRNTRSAVSTDAGADGGSVTSTAGRTRRGVR
jgi:eukaryotic-like serine/threonine-protein kinase